MKFTKRVRISGGKFGAVELDAESAVAHAVDAKAQNYDGEMERIRERHDALAEMFGRLLHELIECGALSRAEQVQNIFDAAYVTVED